MSFVFDNVKYSVKINDNSITLVRDGDDFVNSFFFGRERGQSSYYLKEHEYSVDMEIDVKLLDINDNGICIKYVIVDTGCEYEFVIEMGDVL